MSNSEDNYRRQIELLEGLASKLVSIQSDADRARNDYRKQLNSAKDSGFMKDYTQVLDGEKFQSFSKHIDSLISVIAESRDEINNQKPILQNLKDIAARAGSET
jgi:hypothetical protein